MNSILGDWNATAKAYELFNNAEDSYSYNTEWPAVREMLPELAGKTVLDLGCGTGIFTFMPEREHPAQITGIDLSDEMLGIALRRAEAQGSGARFIQGDATYTRRYIDAPG